MKKLLLSLFVASVTLGATAQVVFKVQSPASIAQTMTATFNGTGWGLTSLLDPTKSVQDTLILINDGTPGVNAQGHPMSATGCGTPTNNIAGKIAVIYRYDGVAAAPNDCGFGAKALKAQQAGAVGVVIINRMAGTMAMGAGTEGVQVTIPIAMVSDSDGAILVNKMATESVVVFIGNKTGKYNDDLGAQSQDLLIAKQYATPVLLAKTESEYSAKVGIKVRNYGVNAQSKVAVRAKITLNGTEVYNKLSDSLAIPGGDSLEFTLPDFSLATYAKGRYKLSYQIGSKVTDQEPTDNIVKSEFVFNDTLFSIVPLDTVTNLPLNSGGVQTSPFNTSFEYCIHFQDPNASRMQADGIYFSAMTNSTDSLSNQEIGLNVYQVVEDFENLTALTAAPTFAPVGQAYYNYPIGNQANLQGINIYQKYEQPVILEDNKRYMFCAKSTTSKIFISSNTIQNYSMNAAAYDQPLSPVINNDALSIAGFASGNKAALAVKMRAKSTAELKENEIMTIKAYPNPSNGLVVVAIPETGNATINVTDMLGKTVFTSNSMVDNGNVILNLENVESGMYLINVVVNSKVAQISIVKK